MTTNARCFDINLLMKDAGLIAADAATQVSAADKILDTGGTGAVFEADLIVDVTAIETATGDEKYAIIVEGSSSASFASGIDQLAMIELGHATPKVGGSDVTDSTGRFIVPFRNERNGTIYRYIRVYVDVTGTIATGINFTAYIAPRN